MPRTSVEQGWVPVEPEEFVELLQASHALRQERLAADWNRSLPFADAMFDRWERARRLGFGERVSIYDSALVYGEVEILHDSWIGPNVLLDGSGAPLSIGPFCSISAGVHVYTHDTVLWAVSGGRLGRRTGPVRIGGCTFVGSQSIILPGVTIGTRCVVAANSLVKRNVPDATIVGGSPARVLGRVEGEGGEVRLRYGAAAAAPERDQEEA